MLPSTNTYASGVGDEGFRGQQTAVPHFALGRRQWVGDLATSAKMAETPLTAA